MPRALASFAESVWAASRRRLHPLLHAGVPAHLSRSEQRELVTGNLVILLSIVVTVPDIFNFLSFRTAAGNLAALYAAIATLIYAFSFSLLALGRRWLGVAIFVNTVLWVLSVNIVLVGTDLGNQYYFAIVGVGVAFVWPRAFFHMRVVHAIAGLILFVLVMLIADTTPLFGPPPPRSVITQLLLSHAISAYVIAIGFVLYSLMLAHTAEDALERERAKSEMLLLNVLPEPIAMRLKEERQVIADRFDSVTVLFVDLVNFTKMSASLPPEDVVAFLNRVFSRFDELTERYGLEKIKTIGDAYMVAAGIPVPRPDHAVAVANVALEMAALIRDFETPTGVQLGVRIGIHSGPAVAGVIGTKKFSYDLWGDTVNTASRMESHGVVGAIQVTSETRALIEREFVFESRGVIDVKGKGPMELHLLVGRKSMMADPREV